MAFACSAGDPDDVGDVEFEMGVVGSWDTFIAVSGFTDSFVGVGEDFDPKPGMGFVVFDFSSKGVFDREVAARGARLDTRSAG